MGKQRQGSQRGKQKQLAWYDRIERRPVVWIALGIFFVALLPRLIHFTGMVHSPYLTVPLIDAYEHHTVASEIANGEWLWKQPLFKAPGYLYWLGTVYALFGTNTHFAILLQMLLGAYSCVMIFVVGRRTLSAGAGIVGSLLYAFYGAAIHHETYLEIVNIEIPICLTGLWLILVAAKRQRLWLWGLCGLLLGVSVATRPTAMLFVPFVLGWIVWSSKRIKPAAGASAALLFGLVCVVSPITLRNVLVCREPILISANGGINFYIGNNADFDRTVSAQPGYEWHRMMREPIRLNRVKSMSDSSAYFYGKSFDYIRSHPIGWLGLVGRKAVMFFSGYELCRNYDYDALRGDSLILRWPVVGFSFVMPLAGIGLILLAYRKQISGELVLLLFFALSIWITNVLFFVDSRYRLPAVTVFCLLAGSLLPAAHRSWESGNRRFVLGWGLLAILLGGGMWLDPGDARALGNWPGRYYEARIAHSLSKKYASNGDQQRAAEQVESALKGYQLALQCDEAVVDAANNLAGLLISQRRYPEAKEACQVGLAVDGAYLELLANLGVAEYHLGSYRESVRAFREALKDNPRKMRVRYFLARSLSAAGDQDWALKELETLIDMGFGQRSFIENESAFAGLRDRDEFQVLLNRLK